MKNIIFTFIVVGSFCCISNSDLYAKKFTWKPSSTLSISGYKIYYGTAPGTYVANVSIGKVTEYEVESLPLVMGQTYYLVVKAYNMWKESPASNEIIYIAGDNTPPPPPTNVKIVLNFNSNKSFIIS